MDVLKVLIRINRTYSTTFLFLIACLVLAISCGEKKPIGPEISIENKDLHIWFDEPANATVKDKDIAWENDEEWLKALPIGNGSLGGMIYGDVAIERVQLNEESMWSGSPANNNNPEAAKALPEIRRLLFEGKYKEATELTNATQICTGKGSGHGRGKDVPFGSSQTLGDLWIKFQDSSQTYTNYKRVLDLNTAIVTVEYDLNGVHFKREYFTSSPDQVMAIKLTASEPGKISFETTLDRIERFETTSENGTLIMEGALHNGWGSDGLEYMVRLAVLTEGGEKSTNNSSIVISKANEAIIYLTASTNYKLDYPAYEGRDYKTLTKTYLERSLSKVYNDLKEDHLDEFQNYFSRVKLQIDSSDNFNIPVNERLTAYKEGRIDHHLEELMFQYGRYLLISSSRPGSLPANLQGLWTNLTQSPWNGDYHTDVNIQMNYWLAETTNLPECHMPYFDLLESLVEPGEETAGVQYDLDGWVVHPITNVWGYTAPGESASWGMHTGAGAWLCQHIMEHFRFTNDTSFLERMFPVLEGSVAYYLGWLVKDPKTGQLVSGPAVSPENTFLTEEGDRAQISMGPAHDQQVIWQLFSDYIEASELLEKNSNYLTDIKKAKAELLGPQIGSDGRLMEWAHEFEEVEPGHRHISHLFAVHPGSQINKYETPELMEAAEKSLDYRILNGSGHTGWSAAWLISQFARMGKGNKAKEALEKLIRESTSYNLFGQHPPFQMDANFGFTAGMAEMLLQSHAGVIELLPAVPIDWSNGKMSGLKARGGYTINMKWKEGKVVSAEVLSEKNSNEKIAYNGKLRTVELKRGWNSINID